MKYSYIIEYSLWKSPAATDSNRQPIAVKRWTILLILVLRLYRIQVSQIRP